MGTLKRSHGIFLLLLGALLLMTPFPAAAAETQLTVAAAASMTEAIDALGKRFEAKTGVKVVASYSASSVATQQVIHGAPFDVLVSANAEWIHTARDRGAILPDSISSIASNRLVLIAASNASIPTGKSVSDILALAAVKKWPIAIAEPSSVPAGIYARQVLEGLGVYDKLKAQLIPLQNVRAVIAYVDRGETPIGFTYATDLRVSKGSRQIAVADPSLHEPIDYEAAVPVHAASPSLGRQFLAFTLSPEGQAILRKFGFAPAASGTGG